MTVGLMWKLGADGVLRSFGHSAGNRPPVPALSLAQSGMATTYSLAASSDPDGDALSYVVDFGDGSAHATAVSGSHTYATVGSYTITATVTDSNGASAVTTGTTVASGPGDAGINQTGVAGQQQIGSGVVLEQDLTPGADLTATIAAAAGSVLSFPAGTFSWNDFAHGIRGASSGSGNSSSGLQVPTTMRGILGAGSASTFLQMNPTTSTKAGGVPAQGSGGTNQLEYISTYTLPDGFVMDGVNIVGTNQGHLYNGLDLATPGNITISNTTVSGVPGSAGSPPGETFMANVYAQAAGKTVTFNRCTFDGRQNGTAVAAALLGTNNTRGTINIIDCLFRGNTYSSTVTIWELAAGATINIVRPVILAGSHRNIGNEAQGGTINITDPIFPDPPGGEDDIRITWTAAYNSGTINVYFTSQATYNAFLAGRTNKKMTTICAVNQSYGGINTAYTGTNDIRNFCHLFVAGVEQPQANVWSFVGVTHN